jgi:hypothetical protein
MTHRRRPRGAPTVVSGAAMKRTSPLLLTALLASSCGSAIAPRQPDGSDCNYAESATACAASSYCDPGSPTARGGYARSHTWGLLRDKTHAVGTCRPKGATGAPCERSEACVSGLCIRRGPLTPGACR